MKFGWCAALRKLGYKPKLFKYISQDVESVTFVEIKTGKKLVLHR